MGEIIRASDDNPFFGTLRKELNEKMQGDIIGEGLSVGIHVTDKITNKYNVMHAENGVETRSDISPMAFEQVLREENREDLLMMKMEGNSHIFRVYLKGSSIEDALSKIQVKDVIDS